MEPIRVIILVYIVVLYNYAYQCINVKAAFKYCDELSWLLLIASYTVGSIHHKKTVPILLTDHIFGM